jgi:TetR/AcrR family tetracycline transcriptional repressor
VKVNRDMAVQGALKLLNDVGLEQLTLRLLGKELHVQAAALYWHFKSKQDLLDAMATRVLADGAPQLLPARPSAEWSVWVTAFGNGLRKVLLGYRDGARMVSGTRLTDTVYMRSRERTAERLMESGFTLRQTVVVLSTVYNYTLSFVMEEQAVFPRPGERNPQYDLAERAARLEAEGLPLSRLAGPILFDHYDRRYREGLELIVRGATPTGR